jgi:cysteine synthase A
MVKDLARIEGILAGISTGASLAAIRSVLRDSHPGQRVITFAYDGGERYLSVGGLWHKTSA